MAQGSRQLLAESRFRRLVGATIANELSSAMSTVVLPLIVLGVTNSPSLAGVAVSASIATLISVQVFAGAIVDRFSPSRTLRISSALQAFGWAIVLCGAVASVNCFALILLGAVIAGGASGFDGPSEHALIKAIIDKESLGRATAVSQGREATAQLLGGPIGGALVSLLSIATLLIQTLLHFVAFFLTPDVKTVRDTSDRDIRHDIVAGYRIVVKHRGLVATSIVAGVANLPIVAFPLTLISHYDRAGFDPLLIGVMTSSFGVGILLGSFIAGPLSSRVKLGNLGIVALLAFAAGEIIIVWTFDQFWVTCAALAVSAVPLPAFNSAIGAYTAAITPERLMGRVVAATGVPGMLLMPVGALFAGVSSDQLGTQTTLAIAAAFAVLAALLMLGSRSLRKIPLLADLDEELDYSV